MLTALATLLLELALTRVLSVVFYYHFAFLAITVALFGMGAGGILTYTFSGDRVALFRRLGGLAALNGVLVVGSLAFMLSRADDLSRTNLALVCLAGALPFLIAGFVVAGAIAETVERIHRVYFFDLLGAAAACMLLIPLLDLVGGSNAVIGAGVLFAASAGVWYTLAGSAGGRVAAVALSLALVALIIFNTGRSLIDVRYAKGEELVDEQFVKWNSFSRVAVSRGAGGVSPLMISVDGDTVDSIANQRPEDLTDAQRTALLGQGPGLPYRLRPNANVLVMTPAGGWDVVRAIASGSRDVTVVEGNPIIAKDVMRDEYADYSHGLYFRPEVNVIVGAPRNFLKASRERYQVIQATFGDHSEPVEAGALALAGNSLLTAEAFEEYLDHLTPDGVLAMTLKSDSANPETLRLAGLAAEALEETGATDVRSHIAVIREATNPPDTTPFRDSVLMARQPFTEPDLRQVERLLDDSAIQAQYLPQIEGAGTLDSFLRGATTNSEFEGYSFDVSPASDNRPYFFYTERASAFWNLAREPWLLRDPSASDPSVRLLVRVLGVGMLATLVILITPPFVLGVRLPRDGGVRPFLLYFVFVGTGYILVQVALIQKLDVFLGNPTYSLTVIVFSMLVSSGLGSYYSKRITADSDRSLMGMLASAALLLASLAVLIAPLVSFGAGWPTPLKVIVAVLVVAPAGFLMGVPFPAGLARLHARNSHLVKWAWSLNVAGSVLGTAGAMFLTTQLGLRETLLFGGVMYILALIAVEMSGNRGGKRARTSEA